MSKESFHEFVANIGRDAALREALQARFGALDKVPAADVLDFAKERGYDFTVDDVSAELADEDLESVSGGGYSYLKWNVQYPTDYFYFNFNKV